MQLMSWQVDVLTLDDLWYRNCWILPQIMREGFYKMLRMLFIICHKNLASILATPKG